VENFPGEVDLQMISFHGRPQMAIKNLVLKKVTAKKGMKHKRRMAVRRRIAGRKKQQTEKNVLDR